MAAQRTKTTLKSYFETYDKPTEEEFAELIDSLQQTISEGTPQTAAFSANEDGSVEMLQMGINITNIVLSDYDPFDENNSENSGSYDATETIYNDIIEKRNELKVPFFISIENSHEKAVIPLSFSYNSSENTGLFYGIVNFSAEGYSHFIVYRMTGTGDDSFYFVACKLSSTGYLPLSGGVMTGDIELGSSGAKITSEGHIVFASGVEIF